MDAVNFTLNSSSSDEAYVDPFEIGKTFARAGMVDEAYRGKLRVERWEVPIVEVVVRDQ